MITEIVDLEEALERVQDDKELLLELMEDFSKDFMAKRKKLEGYIKDSNFAEIKDLIHSVKGAAGNISLKTMHNCCMLMEHLALIENIELIKDLIKDIDAQFEEFQNYIIIFKEKVE